MYAEDFTVSVTVVTSVGGVVDSATRMDAVQCTCKHTVCSVQVQ